MLIYFYSLIFMVISGLISFSLKRKHLLLMLMSLEFIILSMMLFLFMFLNKMIYENYFIMIFLTMSVCEGVLGLAILILMIRTHGNDYFKLFNLLW